MYLKGGRTGADLVGETLGLQLLFLESLLQGQNLSLVLLHCQLDHLARLGDPLIGPRPAGKHRRVQKPHHRRPAERKLVQLGPC